MGVWMLKWSCFSVSAAVRLRQPRTEAALRKINLKMLFGIPEQTGWSRTQIKSDSDWFFNQGTACLWLTDSWNHGSNRNCGD